MSNRKRDLLSRQHRRDRALARIELRGESVPRQSAVGPTSFPVEVRDPAEQAMIEQALKARGMKV
jgi:hypothetical protein